MSYTVIFTPEAESQLIEVYRHIAAAECAKHPHIMEEEIEVAYIPSLVKKSNQMLIFLEW